MRRFGIGCAVVVLVLFVLIIAVVALGSGGSGSGGGGGKASNDAGKNNAASGGPGSGAVFNKDNYPKLVSDPDSQKGASVDVTGQLLDNPERQGGQLAFQMWADPANSDWNTVVLTNDQSLSLKSDDYVHVKGTVSGSYSGQNAFGGDVSAVEVNADSVKKVSAAEAIDPVQKVLPVNKTVSEKGFSITLKKIEFAKKSTRAYVTVTNGTQNVADFSTYDAKIIQGSKQIDYKDSYDYNLKEPQDTLDPGVKSDGVVLFGPVDSAQPFIISLGWMSEDYNINTHPLRFQVNP